MFQVKITVPVAIMVEVTIDVRETAGAHQWEQMNWDSTRVAEQITAHAIVAYEAINNVTLTD